MKLLGEPLYSSYFHMGIHMYYVFVEPDSPILVLGGHAKCEKL